MPHLTLRQRVTNENGFDRLHVIVGVQVHHCEIFVVKLAVPFRRVSVPSDQMVEHVEMGVDVAIAIRAFVGLLGASSLRRWRTKIGCSAMKSSTEHSKIAFIGLGKMGAAMAANIRRAGHPMVVWNRSPDKAAPLLELGARLAETPAAAAAEADIVISSLADDGALTIDQLRSRARGRRHTAPENPGTDAAPLFSNFGE